MCCLPVSADNDTVSVSPPIIQKVTMTIYGDGYYINSVPLPAGTVIVAKDQFKSIIGTYTMRETGRIGKEYGNDKFEIGVWKNQSDKTNRTMPIFITFSIGGIPTKTQLDFKQNENLKFDIISRSLSTDIIAVETASPTSTIKPQATLTPSSVRTLPTAPISLVTSITTPQVTIIESTQLPQVTTSISITPQPTNVPEDNREWIYYGIIATIIIVAGILIVGCIASYLYSKSSRDEVMQQDGTWNRK